MFRQFKAILIFSLFTTYSGTSLSAQEVVSPKMDSIFFSRQSGILGRIGRSITQNGEYIQPINTVGRFKKYHGKIIRTITIVPVGFNYDLNDTIPLKNSFAIRVSNALHRNTLERVIGKNLFFKVGQPFYPLVVADNERFLREQTYLRDAIIEVTLSPYSTDYVDVIILSRDVFSIGGSFDMSSIDRVKAEVKEENLGGRGNRVAFFGLYDKGRSPNNGAGAELVIRNIKGSFINWTSGFNSFNAAFNSGRLEESNIFSIVDKPMSSRYTAVTGSAELSYHSTINAYIEDSVYSKDFRYSYLNTDIWGGYNFGHNSGKKGDYENRLRHFVAMRGLYTNFLKVPSKYTTNYNYRYADINGVLLSYSLYRQNFFRTNFIYGFGRNEDLPKGVNATIIGGYTNKQGIRRLYYGLEMDASKVSRNGSFNSYSFKTGGFKYNSTIQDINVLLAIDHFTKLGKLTPFWYNRNYLGFSYTQQIKPFLNEPLFIRSAFGLPYFRNGSIEGNMRTTVKMESVFYNLKKIFGFRVAPFVFSDLSLIQPLHESPKKINGYPAFGGGIRTRNENLVFGTMELKGFVFPRVFDGMKNWKVELSTKLLFKFNSTFIRRPDFINPN